MDDRTRFLILLLSGESYAIPITRLLEITASRDLQQDPTLTATSAGKIEFRGRLIPVLNVKKLFNLPGVLGETLLVINSVKGIVGLLVDAVTEILDTEQKPVEMPKGVINPEFRYFSGLLRHKENLVLLLNEDGLLP
jgi:purine-binding chemotaxis protein CheW